ncbi:MAG: GIY-YIG nuclease family protein [Candidatus Wallbacteria bacterium]|nr:GIY-YIG nuclease family protein [Candidatus Wallbacteria bacterium]
MKKHFFVYVLRCSGGSLYTGYTMDLEARVALHKSGRGAKYTACHLPVELVYHEVLKTRRLAMQREIAIKRLPKAGKESLIKAAWAFCPAS